MRNFVQPADVITLIAPTGGVVSGNGYLIGSFFAVAAYDADEDEEFEGQLVGAFDLPKATGETWAPGEALYWDDTAKKVTSTGTGNSFIGAAMVDEETGDTIGRVRLNGIAIV